MLEKERFKRAIEEYEEQSDPHRIGTMNERMLHAVIKSCIADSDDELEVKIGEAVENMLSSALSGVGSLLTAFAASLPGVFIFLLITVIASVYFSLDLDKINQTVCKALPHRATEWLIRLKRGFFTTGVRYLRSYAILMAVTFAIVLAGLLILKVEFALLLAIVIAALDILPVFGVGTVLVPWSVFQMLFGDLSLGIGLLVLHFI